MKLLIRLWFRWRFRHALDQADWRLATFPNHPEAAIEVQRLRGVTKIRLPESRIWRSADPDN